MFVSNQWNFSIFVKVSCGLVKWVRDDYFLNGPNTLDVL